MTAGGIFTKNEAGTDRNSFSSNERITLQVRVSNLAPSADHIRFTFLIQSPTGATVFTHAGNAVPGRVGNAASQVKGIPISSFYAGPGVYNFTANATLDGATNTQSLSFTLSSPNIILLYPPNGAQNVADKPLTFRWSAAGGTQYRVTVGDSPSFYNSVFSETTASGESFLSYPENPPSIQKLSAGTVYYWKVEGLDSAGSVVSQSASPFSFTVESAALTRDLAVSGLTAKGAAGAVLTFTAVVQNMGGTTESGHPLKFNLGGTPAGDSPRTLSSMGPGGTASFDFSAEFPAESEKALATACVEFFDDSPTNNCKTLQVAKPPGAGTGDAGFQDRVLSRDEAFTAVCELVKEKENLPDFACVDTGMTAEELNQLLDQLRAGLVEIGVTGPPSASELPAYIPPAVSAEAPDTGAGSRPLSKAEVWDRISEALAEKGMQLDDYRIRDIGAILSAEELQDLLDAIRSGNYTADISGPPSVGAGPVDDAEAFEPRGGGYEPISNEQFWDALDDALAGSGVDLRGYELVSMDKVYSAAELKELVDRLAAGEVEVDLSGPPSVGSGDAGPGFGTEDGGPGVSEKPLSMEEFWDKLYQALKNQDLALEGYELRDIDTLLSGGDLRHLFRELADNRVDVSFSGPPLDSGPLPSYIPPPPARGSTPISEEELWERMAAALKDFGVRLDGYKLERVDRALTAADLQELMDMLQLGAVEVSLTGPDPGGPAPAYTPPLETERPPPPSAAETTGQEWRGQIPFLSANRSRFVIRTAKQFTKVWTRVSQRRAPEIDFERYMIIGIIAGRKDQADNVAILDASETPQGLRIDYRMEASGKGGGKTAVPYHLKVFPKIGTKVVFRRVGGTGD